MGVEETVVIELLGRFRVTVGRKEVAAGAWRGRRAAELVQLLAMADGRRLQRDRVIEALWPRLGVDAGATNLRKAAHYARQALCHAEAVVLRGGQVSLFPSGRVETDTVRFETAASTALASGEAAACAAAAATYAGDLLPEAPYEDWTQAPRAHLRSRYLELLRRSRQWERLVEADPTDEPAYRELMRRDMAAGNRPSAIRWYGRLRTALRRELGIAPSRETVAIYDECVAGLRSSEPDFVGRQFELARIEGLLRSEPRDELLVVRGPAGIGKSALCREVARVAQATDRRVLSATATEMGGPYAPLASVAERIVVEDRAVLDVVGARARSVLSELTALARPAEPLEGALTRHQMIGAFRRLLVAAADDHGVVLVVDDIHLGDEATIDVLQHVARGAGAPIVVVLAYRAEEAPASLTRAVARLVRAGRCVEIDLGPLDRDEAAALVAAGSSTPRSTEAVERIIDLSEGNPFLTLELARSAVAGVPALIATARDAVAVRLVDLDEPTVAMLRRLALAGDDLDPAGVVALTGASETEAFALLDAALRKGVLVVDGAHYRFRHDLVRQALVGQLPPHQQLADHRETARRLADAQAAPALIARHWLEGGRPDEAEEWLLAAAREATRLGAFADALSHLAPLLDHAPDHVEALRLRAEALDALGDAGAPPAYAEAARVAEPVVAHELRAKQALAQIKLGDPPGALRILEGVEPATLAGRLAQALAIGGAAALGFADPAVGTAKAAEARRLALESGDPAAVAVASWAQAAAAHARGELRTSVQTDLRETHSLPRLAISAFDGQLCITQRLLYGARPYPDVIAFADSLAAEAKRLGAARGYAFAVTIRGEAKLLAGALDVADADLAAGAELHRAISAATGESFALQRRAEVALHRGRRADALALLDEALAIARESDVGFHLFDRIYGTRITAAADPQSALAELDEAEAAVRGPVETCPGCRITFAVPATIAAARGGDLERAAEWEQASEFLATVVMRLPAWNAALEEVRGHRAQASGDARGASDHFRDAARVFAAAGQPLDATRCHALAIGA